MHQTLAASHKTSHSCNVLALSSRDNPAILTIAHRGFWTATAENSLASVRAAVAAGVEMIEIDTQATADGRLVVIHDETLDRTTTGKGTVSELSFDVVRASKLKAGAGSDTAAVTDECVPTLEELLEEARGRITVNIDTKFTRDLPQVMETVLRLGVEDQVLVKTDIDPEAGHFEVLDADWFGKIPHMPMFPVRKGKFAEDLRRIEALKAPMIEVKFTDIADLAEGRAEMERQNIRLWINSLDVSHCLDFNDTRALSNPEAVWGALAEAGVGAIQTDEVEAFTNWLKSGAGETGRAWAR
ncbi:glycerophosphodiester phosphodiesterase family protein [Agrobacterium pusense]|uniref:glycerophosphodiester phosphodiesterase family protein n=1 Tax=Agrobacterium pusense TaxID=648995 RepID=UPI0022B91809|nr:glycerophosphodiester phosphodiesterase family protein [Agrobacterium pusense]MCZ7929861.1 glycerophosphodiester phosphodiesterase family protein [Agrobacterium pusense]